MVLFCKNGKVMLWIHYRSLRAAAGLEFLSCFPNNMFPQMPLDWDVMEPNVFAENLCVDSDSGSGWRFESFLWTRTETKTRSRKPYIGVWMGKLSIQGLVCPHLNRCFCKRIRVRSNKTKLFGRSAEQFEKLTPTGKKADGGQLWIWCYALCLQCGEETPPKMFQVLPQWHCFMAQTFPLLFKELKVMWARPVDPGFRQWLLLHRQIQFARFVLPRID